MKLNIGQQSIDILEIFQETIKIICVCMCVHFYMLIFLTYAYVLGHLLFLILQCSII